MIWIFEQGHEQKLLESVNSNGFKSMVLGQSYYNIVKNGFDIPKIDEPSLLLGSLNLINRARKETNLGICYNWQEFLCTNYYLKFPSELMLNSPCLFLPYGLIKQSKDFLFDKWPTLFIRPNSGSKPFTGSVVEYDTFDRDIQFDGGLSKISENELCLVSSACRIMEEVRFVVVDGQVITGSFYRLGNKLHYKRAMDSYIRIAQNIVNQCSFNPDPVWVLDLCLSGGDFYVLEVNSFSCAGLYECDMDKIVQAVSACEEFQ